MEERYLFRGKKLFYGEWIIGNLITSPNGIIKYIIEKVEPKKGYCDMQNVTYEVVAETIGQCTGVKDKNGKLIFEGDRWKREEFIGIIIFQLGGWTIERAEDSGSYQYPSFYSNAKTGEIIGNIHDTPRTANMK